MTFQHFPVEQPPKELTTLYRPVGSNQWFPCRCSHDGLWHYKPGLDHIFVEYGSPVREGAAVTVVDREFRAQPWLFIPDEPSKEIAEALLNSLGLKWNLEMPGTFVMGLGKYGIECAEVNEPPSVYAEGWFVHPLNGADNRTAQGLSGGEKGKFEATKAILKHIKQHSKDSAK